MSLPLRSGERAWVYIDAAAAESLRVEQLRDAQANAIAQFEEVERRGIIRPGVGEGQASDDIRDLANELFGATRHWHKRRLVADLPVVFDAGRGFFAERPEITGAELHAEIDRLARERGWVLGNVHAGHLVGEFPHEKIDGADIESYIAPGNTTPMRRTDRAGRRCHWILEVHLIDRERGFGGFYEQLLGL